MFTISRRTFLAQLGALGIAVPASLSAFSNAASSEELPRFVRARCAFVSAITSQKRGSVAEAEKHARLCLSLLEGMETMEETAAGEIVAVEGCLVCEPSFLHVDTARRCFRYEGILV